MVIGLPYLREGPYRRARLSALAGGAIKSYQKVRISPANRLGLMAPVTAPACRLWLAAGPSGAGLALTPIYLQVFLKTGRLEPRQRPRSGSSRGAWGNLSSSMSRRSAAVTAASSSSGRSIVGMARDISGTDGREQTMAASRVAARRL